MNRTRTASPKPEAERGPRQSDRVGDALSVWLSLIFAIGLRALPLFSR